MLSGIGIMISGIVWNLVVHRADAQTPSITITPAPDAGSGSQYGNGEAVKVSVGGNSLFGPGLRVNILECADPGGTTANLPKSISDCDGNTIQGDTVLAGADGSVTEAHYTIYALPSATLGEQANWQPRCDITNECVLYVGENQEDFTQPKLFSAPFTVSSATSSLSNPGSPGGTGTSGGTSAGGEGTSSTSRTGGTGNNLAASASNSATAQGSLADTGAPPAAPWLLVLGLLLTVGGFVGRRTIGAEP